MSSWFLKCVHRVTPLGWGSPNTPGLGKLAVCYRNKSNNKNIVCCVRRRRTHTNRVVFTEITLAGFVDQCRGYRS